MKIDDAIDQVAARLVAVPGNDAELSQRIISALPERTSRLRWLIPQLTALAAIAIAAIVWTSRLDHPTPPALPSAALNTRTTLATAITANSPVTFGTHGTFGTPGTQPLEPLEPLEPLDRPDFDRALPALETIAALAISDVSTSDIAAPLSIGPAPIEIIEIPMTADFPPRPQE